MGMNAIELVICPVRCLNGHRAELCSYDINGGWFRVYCDCGALWLPDGPERRESVQSEGGVFPDQLPVRTLA